MINEKKLINYIKGQINPFGNPTKKSAYEFGLQIMEYIMETAEEGCWIPCGEKLPPNYQRVLTCDEKGNEHIMFHHKDFKYPFGVSPEHTTKYTPVAWMPLPEPYGGSND